MNFEKKSEFKKKKFEFKKLKIPIWEKNLFKFFCQPIWFSRLMASYS